MTKQEGRFLERTAPVVPFEYPGIQQEPEIDRTRDIEALAAWSKLLLRGRAARVTRLRAEIAMSLIRNDLIVASLAGKYRVSVQRVNKIVREMKVSAGL